MQTQKKEEAARVIKFVLFSASAGLIQFSSFTLMSEIFKWSYWVCYLIALVLSVIWNFTLNREFTFKSANNVPVAMLKVAAYYAVFMPVSTLWGNALTNIGWDKYIVILGTMLINFATEFLFDRLVVFRNSINSNARALRDAEKAAEETQEEST